MSESVPLLLCALDRVTSHTTKWNELKMDKSSLHDAPVSDFRQNGHCECRQSSDMSPGAGQDMEVSSLDRRAAVHSDSQMEAENVKDCGAKIPQQKDESPADTPTVLDKCCHKHLPASMNTPEDVLRVVKHHPSAIVFCDYDCGTGNQVINESSDGGESSSSTSKEVEGEDGDDDDFPATLQYKEFLVSRRRRNLSRNRKCLRRRRDAQPNSTPSDWQKLNNKGKPGFTGSQEEEDTWEKNGKQVRKIRGGLGQ